MKKTEIKAIRQKELKALKCIEEFLKIDSELKIECLQKAPIKIDECKNEDDFFKLISFITFFYGDFSIKSFTFRKINIAITRKQIELGLIKIE